VYQELKRGLAAVSVAALLWVLPATAAHAESLHEALRWAYESNPTLQAERAKLRATDELVPLAKSGWRPTVVARGSAQQQWSNTDETDWDGNASANLSIELSQPIFNGFKTVEGVKRAKAQIQASRQGLLTVEQNVLFTTIRAYAAIIRDQRILELRKRNVTNLQKQLRASQARFEVGEITRTDVDQSRARLASAEAGVAVARANLKTSMANYLAVTGRKAGKLKHAKAAKVPGSLDSALAEANKVNPNILAAAFVYDAALHDVEIAKGDLLPTIGLSASANTTFNPDTGNPDIDRADSVVVQGVLTVPLYQSGAEYAQVRQQKQVASQRQIEIIGATRSVREQVASSWNVLVASRDSISSSKVQVSAAARALDGVQQEYQVGSRSTIDVLNAEQELLNARVTQVSAEHDALVASYQLLASIGRLTARELGVPGALYDPEENYHNVKNKWIGLDAETVE
jgi:outer membrane protein